MIVGERVCVQVNVEVRAEVCKCESEVLELVQANGCLSKVESSPSGMYLLPDRATLDQQRT